MQELLSTKFLDALEFASIAHQDQKRFFPENVPYISHVFAVALILQKAGYEEDVVIAGLLHDIVEDTYFTGEDIRSKFGDQVADLVLDVTEDKNLPWEERKKGYREHLRTSNEYAKAISAADLLANRLSLLLPLEQEKNPWRHLTDRSPKEFLDLDSERMQIVKQGAKKEIVENLEMVLEKIKARVK